MAVQRKQKVTAKKFKSSTSSTVKQKLITTGERKRKQPTYKSFRLAKKIPHPAGPVPGAWKIGKKSLLLVKKNAKALAILLVIYALLNLVFVRGFTAPIDIAQVKETMSELFGASSPTGFSLAAAIFGSMLGGTGTESATTPVYQSLLFIVASLALIWIFRQSSAGNKPTARGAFYNGMYPIVPFLLVGSVMMIQLIPAYFGGLVYGIIRNNGLATTAAEQVIWLLLFGALIVLSLYMICSSLFALYIVTLPDMRPMQALRSARQLVFSRRMSVIRKLLFMPLIAFIFLVLVVIPAIYFIPVIAPWLYFVLSLASVIFLHAYLYTLYKELL